MRKLIIASALAVFGLGSVAVTIQPAAAQYRVYYGPRHHYGFYNPQVVRGSAGMPLARGTANSPGGVIGAAPSAWR